jgi:hypothetical protein
MAKHRHHAHKRAHGGPAMKGRYSFVNSPVESEAKSTKDKFRHGGLKAHGHKSKARADRKARGGAAGFARGGTTHSPFSSAARGNDMGRLSRDKDNHQPLATGGVAAFKHGGRTKRHAGIGGKHGKGGTRHGFFPKHEYNYGGHHGQGWEEPMEHHKPVHHKHGGEAKGKGSDTGPVHAGHGGHMAHHPHHDGHHKGHHGVGGPHKAKGKKHRAAGGGVGLKHGGKADMEDD